ncbi:MAG: transposase [Spirochaetaceae bacterium]|nr:transposase [Spirochaetaceae bacterium]
MKKFTLEFKKAVVDEYNTERYTMAQVAKKFGVSESVVYKWVHLDRAGELDAPVSKPTGIPRKITDDSIVVMKEMYCNGYGIGAIGKHLGISPVTVKKYLIQSGIYLGIEGLSLHNNLKGRKDKFSDDMKRLIVRDYVENNLTVSRLCEKYKASAPTITKILNSMGICNPSGGQNGITRDGEHYDKNQVIADHNTGLYTHKNLAEKYKVSTRTISRILASAGLKAIGSVPRTPSDVVAQVRDGVLAALVDGKDVYEVAELHKIPVDTVKRITGGRKESEDSVPETSVGMGAGIEDKVVSLHEGGRKMTEIAEELGLTAYTVRKVLVEHGLDTKMVRVDKPSSGTKSDRVRDDVLAAHNDGLGAADIAARCGVSIPTVRKVLREAGVVPHKHTVHDDAAGCGEGKPLLSAQQQEELNQVVDQVGSKAAEGIVSQEDTGPQD